MKLFGVTANVMSLAGIAIAIGTMVDMGIVLIENMVERFEEATTPEARMRARARRRRRGGSCGGTTSVLTTILSFLPVFGLTAAEGKLFGPLAFAKTFALSAALVLSSVRAPHARRAGCCVRASPVPLRRLHGINAHGACSVRRRTSGRGCSVALGVGARAAGALDLWASGIRWSVWRASPQACSLHRGIARLLGSERARRGGCARGGSTRCGCRLVWGQPGCTTWCLWRACRLGLLALFWVFLKVYEPMLMWTLSPQALFLTLPAMMIVTWGRLSGWGLIACVGGCPNVSR